MNDCPTAGQPLHASNASVGSTGPARPRFRLGQLVGTPAALEALLAAGVSPLALIRRHVTGDFGDLDEHDRQANEEAIAHGLRVFSAYTVTSDSGESTRVYVITEAGRSATTVLRAEDY